jgi:hypothetical protein
MKWNIMKTTILFTSLAFAAGASAESKVVEISMTAQVEVQNVKIACVQYVDATGAGKGYKTFYAAESLPLVNELKKSNITGSFITGPEFCSPTNKGTLTLIDVPDATKPADIDAKILAAGGYKEMKVIFYNYDQFGKDFNTAKINAFNSL